MSAKRKHRTPNEYLKYLKGELSREERYTFERDLQADPFEMDAMEGMEQVPAGELEEDLLSIHADMHKRLKRRRRRTYYSIAASVASLMIVGTVFLNIYNLNPRSAEEGLPDEAFLKEEAVVQSESSLQEEKTKDQILLEEAYAMDQELTEKEESSTQLQVSEQIEAPAPETARMNERAQLGEEEQDEAQAQVQEKALVTDVVPEQDEAPVPDVVSAPDEIVVQEDLAFQAVEMISEDVEAPAQVAEDLVIEEARPSRAQKKGRAQQAPEAYLSERVGGIVLSSEDMEPLPGASLMVKGSNTGTVADMEGRFSLVTDQQRPATVIASYVGMETGEYQLAGNTENRVVMQPDLATLNEVVVIGYDADKSSYATGAVQTIKLDKEESKYSGAEPEGGLEAYKKYIEEQIQFPAGYTDSKREVVVLKFNVALDGSISRIITLRSPGEPYTEETIRLLNEGPSWKPAKDESGATEDVVRMRIVFKR